VFEDDKKWSDIKAREELVGGGTCYSLAHLRDAEYRFRIPASGRYPELEIIILVIFGSHCISWGPSRGEEIDFGAYGEDHRIIDERVSTGASTLSGMRCLCTSRASSGHLWSEIACSRGAGTG